MKQRLTVPVSKAVLEQRAVRVLRQLGLKHHRTRMRKRTSRGTDVDMVFIQPDFLMSKWHVRFKACKELTLDDVATEVGIAQGFRNRVALVATTGDVSEQARRYATHMNEKTGFQVIVLGGSEIALAKINPCRLRRVVTRQAPFAFVIGAFRGVR